MKLKLVSVGILAAALAPAVAAAGESSFSIYGGLQSLPHSNVSGTDQSNTDFAFTAGWEGKPFAMPPYWGVRYTHWADSGWGWSVDFAHSKAYADDATLADSGFAVLEFTDGINVLTANVLRRFENDGRWTPYVGFGLGIAVPNVEITPPTAIETFEYQYAGLAAQAQIGVDYEINEKWSVFTEYKMNYVMVDVDLVGGGFLKTDLVVNAFNLGVSRSF